MKNDRYNLRTFNDLEVHTKFWLSIFADSYGDPNLSRFEFTIFHVSSKTSAKLIEACSGVVGMTFANWPTGKLNRA